MSLPENIFDCRDEDDLLLLLSRGLFCTGCEYRGKECPDCDPDDCESLIKKKLEEVWK